MASGNEMNPENEDVCVVCCKKITIFAIGTCDHPVCYECSTRMRVLCKQNECPICRRDMQKVIFTETKAGFVVLMEKINAKSIVLQEKSIGVIFDSIFIQKCYQKLLEHRCPICSSRSNQQHYDNFRFRTFNDLKEHVRREHELFYCDLCVANLNIFTSERRCYTRQERATHRRKGDVDNKSHRGHPLCQFCDTRYMDLDELFRHLRRDHFFCHFCDMESANNQYYNNYDDLRAHFLQEHYLCEEGNCRIEQFTSVFKSLIDLKAHQASVHSKDLSKNAVKQARTVEVAFTLKPRLQKSYQKNQQSDRNNHNHVENGANDEEGAVGYDNSRLKLNNSIDFPCLTPEMDVKNTIHVNVSKKNRPETNLSIRMSVPMSSSVQIRPKSNDFPALTQSNSKVETPRWVNRGKLRPETSNGAILKVNPSDFRNDFPALTKKKDEIVKKRSTITLECNSVKKDVKNDATKKKINDKVKKKKKLNENELNLTKKVSELKINELKNDLINNKDQNSDDNAPPGFSGKKLKPPPGFESYQNLLPSEMTFTNSTGQSFSIPTKSRYKPPKNFEMRNESLIKNLNEVINNNVTNNNSKSTKNNSKKNSDCKTSILEFKRLSALFRNGEFDAKSYFDLCLLMMEYSFDVLFPELLILLPDVGKQRELFDEFMRRKSGDVDKLGLEVCSRCDQVVLRGDLGEHLMEHALENDFPVLKGK
nr:E3 ubiquitin-protein ligase ZNF598 [Onthophagus taurus]XP_022914032.1 E3 ubiquitin-protein ligase ZNF598 [Onthophagus taurus]